MARSFVAASSQYVEQASAVVGAYPFTMGCWVRSSSSTASQIVMCMANSASNDNYHFLRLQGDVPGDPVQALTNIAGGEASAVTSSGYTANTWHHILGVWAADADRRVFIDGGSKGTSATSRAFPANLNRTAIGRLSRFSPVLYLSGEVAEAAIWNIALDDADATRLALGISPLLVRPEALVACWPLIGVTGPEPDFRNAYGLTVTGATKADHPRIVYPSAADVYAVQAAAAAGHPAMRRWGGVPGMTPGRQAFGRGW